MASTWLKCCRVSAPLSAIASRAFLFSLGFGHLGRTAGCIAARFCEPVSRARATSSKTARNTHSRSARRNHSDQTYEPWISSLLVDLMSPTAVYHRWSRTSWRTSKLSWGVLGFPLSPRTPADLCPPPLSAPLNTGRAKKVPHQLMPESVTKGERHR